MSTQTKPRAGLMHPERTVVSALRLGEGAKFFVSIEGSGKSIRHYRISGHTCNVLVSHTILHHEGRHELVCNRNGDPVPPLYASLPGMDGRETVQLLAHPDCIEGRSTFLFIVTGVSQFAEAGRGGALRDRFRLVLSLYDGTEEEVEVEFDPVGESKLISQYLALFRNEADTADTADTADP